VGDVPALVEIGPGDDPDERRKAHEGRAYNAVAIIAHEQCVHGCARLIFSNLETDASE
jgi:hypothetical protein